MKRFNKSFWALMLSFCVCVFAASCSDDPKPEPAVSTPEISISNIIPDVETVTFTLTSKDANAYEYACVLTSEFESGAIVSMTRKEGAAPAEPIKVEGLNASTAYTIVARAYNGELGSKTVSQATTTLAAPSEAPVLTLSEPVVEGQSVSFKITHTGECATYNYAVYEKSQSIPEDFKTVAAKDTGAEIEINNLKGETTYVIEAYGSIGEIVSDHVKKEFTTETASLEVVISDITTTDAHIRATMDQEVCTSFYIGGYSTANSLTTDDILALVKSQTTGVYQTSSINALLSELQIDGLSGGLTPETDYVVWWVALDADSKNDKEESAAVVASMIQKTQFTTKGYDLTSPATVAVSVESISTQSANVKFTPSSDAVKYYYRAIPKTDIEKSYFTDRLLVNHLIAMGRTETVEKTVEITSLNPETAYVFCAIAEDKDGKFSVPVKVEESTPGFSLDSPVTFELAQFSGTIADPQENAQFVINADDLSNVQEIRYINVTRADYSSQTWFGGKDTKVLSSLLSGAYPTNALLPEELTRGRLPKFTQLEPAENYYCFAILLDKDGKFTEMQKVSYKTASYDLTGVATATWEINSEVQVIDGKGLLAPLTDYTLKITPSADCVEMWVFIRSKAAMDAQATKTLIRQAKQQEAGWYAKGTSPWITGHGFVGDGYMVAVICKDKDGKYNDIRGDMKPIENKYSNSAVEPDPDPGIDPKEID